MPTVTERLCELVRFDTRNPGGDERPLAEHLAHILRESSPDELEIKDTGGGHGYVWACFGEAKTLVNVHLDTVPAGAGWSRAPLTPVVSNGRVFGLGAADTKGAIAAVLTALEAGRPRDVAILLSGDEERDNSAMRAFLADLPPRPALRRAVVCEPTSLQLGIRHRGIMAFRATAKSEGGHSSRADLVRRPIAELARMAVALDDWGRARAEIGPPGFPGMCLNVAEIRGGVAFNVIPTVAELVWSVRPPPGAELEAVRTELLRVLPPGVVWETTLANPPFATDDVASFRELLGGSGSGHGHGHGHAIDTVDLGFWTEAALLAQSGIDAVVWGPGSIAAAHSPDESVASEELEAAARTLQDLFRGYD